MGALLGACVVSYFSGFITVHEDVSTEATVGITHFNGFPIWFYEQAPGISVFSAWHFERFMWNTVLWAVLFSVFIFWIIYKFVNNKFRIFVYLDLGIVLKLNPYFALGRFDLVRHFHSGPLGSL